MTNREDETSCRVRSRSRIILDARGWAPSGFLRLPTLEGAFEGGDGLMEAVLVLFVEVSGLAGEAAGGVGDLVARAEHLGVEPLERGAVRAVADHVQLLAGRGDPLLAPAEDLLPVRPLVDVDAL